MYISTFDLFLVFCFVGTIWLFSKNSTFRKKLPIFFLFNFLAAVWGFYFSLDVFILFLLATEFLIISLLLLISFTLYYQRKDVRINYINLRTLVFFCILSYFLYADFGKSSFSYTYCNLYLGLTNILPTDLFLFFFVFFMTWPTFVYALTLILSFFTIFFILFFFKARSYQQAQERSKRSFILRKQCLAHQAMSTPSLRMFKTPSPLKVIIREPSYYLDEMDLKLSDVIKPI